MRWSFSRLERDSRAPCGWDRLFALAQGRASEWAICDCLSSPRQSGGETEFGSVRVRDVQVSFA
jgi:hypothetical protein